MTEVYKSLNGLAPPIITNMFTERVNHYNLRNFRELKTESRSTVRNGTETLLFRAPQLWQILPPEIKASATLDTLKKKIKQWQPENCPCRICKNYIPNLGFV